MGDGPKGEQAARDRQGTADFLGETGVLPKALASLSSIDISFVGASRYDGIGSHSFGACEKVVRGLRPAKAVAWVERSNTQGNPIIVC